MKKRFLIPVFVVFLSVLIINFASAQFYGSYGRGFSITDFIDSVGPSDLIFMASFIIFFALLFYSLGKVFKDSYGSPNKPVAGTVSLAGAFMASYGLYRSGFDLTGFFYEIGIDTGLLYPILAIVFLAFSIFIIRYLKISGFLMLLGALFLAIALFTDIVYERGVLGIIGGIILAVGFFIWRRKKKGRYYDYPSPRRQSMFDQIRGRRKDISNVRHEQRLDYERQKTEQKYQRRLRKEEVKRRGKNIAKIRKRRERKETARQEELQRQNAIQSRKKQAQGQIQKINQEIPRLKKLIRRASVIERGKIEDQIRMYERRARELRRFL